MKLGVEEIRALHEPCREASLLHRRVAVWVWTRTNDGRVVAADQHIEAGHRMPRLT